MTQARRECERATPQLSLPGTEPGMVDSQVISAVIDADLVIADLSTKNANAFYELGIRHLLQKPIIHMFRRKELPPADIAAYRGIESDLVERTDVTAAKSALRKAVIETQKSEFKIENPVTRANGFLRLKQGISKKDFKPLDIQKLWHHRCFKNLRAL
jgi:hypothetical protein